MLVPATRLFRTHSLRQLRFYTTPADVQTDLRTRLMAEVKTAMKSKDIFTSTTLRSVLSEIYSADKVGNGNVTSSAIAGILRKAVQRRTEAASKFVEASRTDLAEKEKLEAALLSKFLPPLMSEKEIDQTLSEIIKSLPPGHDQRRSLGVVFKQFYSKVDKSLVESNSVKKRAEELLAAASIP